MVLRQTRSSKSEPKGLRRKTCKRSQKVSQDEKRGTKTYSAKQVISFSDKEVTYFGTEAKESLESKEEILTDVLKLRNVEWCLERAKKGLLPIWTMDIETDPFKHGNKPQPFAVGLYDGILFHKFWGKDCLSKAKAFLEDADLDERGIVFMHNGGRFDFFYLLDWFEGNTVIMNSRIVKAYMWVGDSKPDGWSRKKEPSHHRFEFRDSYAIMPFALAKYKKKEIEIQKLAKEMREQNKQEILSYLEGDCVYLWELCMEFTREFGEYLTIASAAFKQLSDRHSFDKLPKAQDAEIRSAFYFGGRVECFQKGIVEQPCYIYDVNSMYPFVMKTFWHPSTWICEKGSKLQWSDSIKTNEHRTYFLTVEGFSQGAFPKRTKQGVNFPVEFGTFYVTVHEYLAAIELGLFRGKILETLDFYRSTKFDTFVDHFFNARKKADKAKDEMHKLFYKLILNSAYGKFGLNPENYFEWKLTKTEEKLPEPWELDSLMHGSYYVWKRPTKVYDWNLYNIATAASITGAARAMLMRAIFSSKDVLYCDTDSLICGSSFGGKIGKALGEWKAEGSGTLAAIAGKKMYAIFDDDKCVKHANKGVSLEPEQIKGICMGKDVITFRDAPTFQRDGSAKFISRTVRMT